MITVKPSTPYGYTIFCDDIRQEAGGKFTYVGVYGADLIVQGTLPAMLPKLGFSIVYKERPFESTEPVEIRVTIPGQEKPVLILPIPNEAFRNVQPELFGPDIDDPVISITLNAVLSPLRLRETGRIKVRAYRGDAEIRLGTLGVIASQPSQQPEAVSTGEDAVPEPPPHGGAN